MQRRAGTGPRNVTTAWDDHHLVHMAMTDHTALHPQCWVDAGVLQQVWTCPASTVRRRHLRAGLVARMPLHQLPLSRDHQRLRLQWARECCHWHAEWQNVVFLDESRFNKSYNYGCICVRRFASERKLRACNLQRHRGPMPSVMVWGGIGYNMRSCLLLLRATEQQLLH